MKVVQFPLVLISMTSLVFFTVAEVYAASPKSFGEVYAERGAPLSKEVFEAKRQIVWKYGSERVVFKDGIVVAVQRIDSPVTSVLQSKPPIPVSQVIEKENAEQAERRQERLRVTRDRMKERKKIPGVGPAEDLNDSDVAGMLSAFAAAGEKDENKAPGAMGAPLGSDFSPPPIEAIP
jgi:hypothetical protein